MPATLTHPAQAQTRTTTIATRLLHAWHLLSLDAPTVAVIWTAFFARTTHLTIPATELLALFLAVWLLYVADRLLDSRQPDSRQPPIRMHHVRSSQRSNLIVGVEVSHLRPGSQTPPQPPTLQPRHLFHRTHRRAFLATATLTATALIPLTLHLPARDLHLDLALAAALAFWFLLIHRLAPTRALPKELAVGLFFAAAALIPTLTRHPPTLALLAGAILFATLCTLNGLYITLWEDHRIPFILQPHRRISGSTLTLIVASAITALVTHSPAIFAITLSATALFLLNRTRHHLHPTTLRAAADLALLTPILLWPFLP